MHHSIRLFALCQNMKWSHLPVAGGLYDQHPQLLEEWEVIFSEVAAYEAEQEAKREQEAGRSRPNVNVMNQ